MTKYDIIKLPGASPDLVKKALNDRSEEGWILEFVDNGWFILARWEDEYVEDKEGTPKEDTPLTNENIGNPVIHDSMDIPSSSVIS